MELSATLELGADHRFRYQLSYGALDEQAEGKWESATGEVLLTSDPTTPPSFSVIEEAPSSGDRLDLQLDVPRGISRQYFGAILRFADGRSVARQFAEEGLIVELQPEERVVSLKLVLSVLDVESQEIRIASDRGGLVHVRFEPNDLGKVAFAKTPLKIDQDDLLLERHERLVRFRRSGGCEG
jgi:hypothetical protein